jgi:hypothetical protein
MHTKQYWQVLPVRTITTKGIHSAILRTRERVVLCCCDAGDAMACKACNDARLELSLQVSGTLPIKRFMTKPSSAPPAPGKHPAFFSDHAAVELCCCKGDDGLFVKAVDPHGEPTVLRRGSAKLIVCSGAPRKDVAGLGKVQMVPKLLRSELQRCAALQATLHNSPPGPAMHITGKPRQFSFCPGQQW